NFPGNFEGISVLNILLYQAISFIILVSLFLIILGIIIKISSLIETVLKFTIILGIPSKILGFIVGLIEGFIVTYMVLFFIKQPLFNSEQINKSKFMTPILTSTPVLSNIASNMNDTFKDIYLLKDKFKNEDKNTFNLEALDVMLKYDIVKPSSIDLLVKNDKLKDVKNIDSILSKYRK
ncbi:MAG: CvpA family protein, partial [Bacilli bacterium]